MSITVYLDTSAVLKRIFIEKESDALQDALSAVLAADGRFVTSALARIEVSRALRRRSDAEPPVRLARAFVEALAGVATAAITDEIVESARIIGSPFLRSLDAVHLATAVALGVDELWTYDQRMAEAAEELGIPSGSPA